MNTEINQPNLKSEAEQLKARLAEIERLDKEATEAALEKQRLLDAEARAKIEAARQNEINARATVYCETALTAFNKSLKNNPHLTKELTDLNFKVVLVDRTFHLEHNATGHRTSLVIVRLMQSYSRGRYPSYSKVLDSEKLECYSYLAKVKTKNLPIRKNGGYKVESLVDQIMEAAYLVLRNFRDSHAKAINSSAVDSLRTKYGLSNWSTNGVSATKSVRTHSGFETYTAPEGKVYITDISAVTIEQADAILAILHPPKDA